jgi:hypothetical protein
MSSDCFDVRIARVEGTEVVFDVLTGLAGDVDDIATSRSFALVLLADALGRASEVASTKNERQRLSRKEKGSALAAELRGEDDNWFVNESWMRKNVGRFVASCDLVERRNHLAPSELERREKEIERQFGGTLTNDQVSQWQPLRWQRCHDFTLRVVVTEPRWAEHLETGLEFGTTASDVVLD